MRIASGSRLLGSFSSHMADLPVYQMVSLSRMMKLITVCGASLIQEGANPFQRASGPSRAVVARMQSIGPLNSPGCSKMCLSVVGSLETGRR